MGANKKTMRDEDVFTFKRYIAVRAGEAASISVDLTGKEIANIVMTYLAITKFKDSSYAQLQGEYGGAILDTETFTKFIEQKFNPCTKIRAELKVQKEILTDIKKTLERLKDI